jgi:hypothetical protein
MRKPALIQKLERLNALAPLPSGYHYQIDYHGGPDAPGVYNLAVVRDDFQGGNFIDLPSIGGFTLPQMVNYLEGMLEGLEWKARIKYGLPEVPPAGCAQFEGTEGQDRKSYADDQDRENYTEEGEK